MVPWQHWVHNHDDKIHNPFTLTCNVRGHRQSMISWDALALDDSADRWLKSRWLSWCSHMECHRAIHSCTRYEILSQIHRYTSSDRGEAPSSFFPLGRTAEPQLVHPSESFLIIYSSE
jgi:hypothetical protein